MKEELVSVIIPVYKVEDFLKRCIDSVIKQSYKKLEIILVDDGSPDKCPEICESYREKDKRITVIHKNNGGLSDARNAGIDIAKGDFIVFVDSDDYLPTNAIQQLYEKMKKYDCDIVCGDYEIVPKKGQSYDKPDDCVKIFSSIEALESLLYMHDFYNSAWGKIYKRGLFSDIRYPKGKISEDLGTTYKLFSKAKKVVATKKIVYCYYQNPDSITHRKYSRKSSMDGITLAEEELSFIKDNYSGITNAAKYRLFYQCISTINDIPLFHGDRKEVAKIMKKSRKGLTFDGKLYMKQRLLCIVSYFGQIAIKITFRLKGIFKK